MVRQARAATSPEIRIMSLVEVMARSSSSSKHGSARVSELIDYSMVNLCAGL